MQNTQFKNILAFRNDRFGEFLLNIPALRALKETYPQARITVVVNPYVKELAESIEAVDEVITWEGRKHRLAEIIAFANKLGKENYDLCIVLNPSQESHLVSFLSWIPVRVGYNRKWPFLLNKKIPDTKHLAQKHEVEYNLELVSLIGAKTGDSGLSLRLEGDIIKKFSLPETGGFVAVHPWTSDPLKQWPILYFKQLVQRLLQEEGLSVVIVGGKENVKQSQELFSGFDRRLVNLTGTTSLKELAGVLKQSRLLVSCDSGPVHLACAVGTRVVALFRNDLPGKSALRWGPRGKEHAVIEKSDLSEIMVEEVVERVKEVLK